MAKSRAKITRRQTWAFGVEATTGTAATVTASDAALVITDPSWSYEDSLYTRPAQGSTGNTQGVPGPRLIDLSCTTELIGLGAVGLPLVGRLLQAAGFALDTDTFNPVTSADTGDTLTVGRYLDGTLETAVGCAFSYKITAEKGKPALIEFDGNGVLKTAPADAALIVPARPAVLPPTFVNATVTLDGVPIALAEVEIEGNVEVVMREDANDPTGVLSYQAIPGVPRFTLKPERQPLATVNYFAKYAAAAEMPFSMVLGSAENNTITITAPKLQLVSDPSDDDDDGKVRDELKLDANTSDGEENDAIAIAFT